MKSSVKATIIISIIPVFLIFIIEIIRSLFWAEWLLTWIRWILVILFIIPVVISSLVTIYPRISKNAFISSISNSIYFYLSFSIILIAVNRDIFPQIARYDMSMIGVGLAVFVIAKNEYERRNPKISTKKFTLTNKLNTKYEKLKSIELKR